MKRLFVVIAFAATAIVFNSCGPSKYTVVEQPAPPVYERPVSPHPQYVWVEGEWHWHGDKYVYSNGYWAKPKGHRTYVAGKWEHSGKGYYWKEGHWK